MRRHELRPDVPAPRRWYFPEADRHYLDSGLQVMAFHRPGQHIASVGLVIDTPLTLERRDIEGVATLVCHCLDEGTTSHPGTSFTMALEDLGAVMGGSVDHAATRLFLEVPVPQLGAALGLLAEAVTQPTLAPEDVSRHRALRLAQIDQLMANSAQRAAIEFRKAVVERRCRASRMAGGTATGVAAVSVEDVRDFHARYYRPSGATLVLCGDFTADPFTLAEAAFAGWAGEAAQGIVHQSPAPRAPRARLVNRPGAVQADVRLGGFGIDRGDPTWADLQVACHAVGGAFLSRLNRVLREEKAFTYGVHLVNHAMRDGGLLAAQGSFRTDVTVEAISLASGLLDLTAHPLTADEVSHAVGYTLGSSPLRYSTAQGVTDRVTTLVANGLSAEFINSSTEALEHVTPASATRSLMDLLPPDRRTLVVVGDAEALAGPLRDAGWDIDVR